MIQIQNNLFQKNITLIIVMSQASTLKPLRPAASLVINLSDEGKNANRILTLLRKPHMSFANSIVFPGGVTEKIDKKYLQKDKFQKYAKITAIRQTLQQTGILILPPKVQCQKLETFREDYKNSNCSQIQEFIVKTWSKNLQFLLPLVRLVTPQIKKMSRYDCMFYLLQKQVQKINLGRRGTLEQLEIHTKQSNNYFWLEPKDYLLMCLKKQIELPPPQIILFNIFQNVPVIELKDLILKKPVVIEPLFFQFSPSFEITMLGDKDFDQKRYNDNQPKSEEGQEIKRYLMQNKDQKKKYTQLRRIKIGRTERGIQAKLMFKGMVSQKTVLQYLPIEVLSSI